MDSLKGIYSLKIITFNAGKQGRNEYTNSLDDKTTLQTFIDIFQKSDPDVAFFQEISIEKYEEKQFPNYFIISGGQNLAIFFKKEKFEYFKVGQPDPNDFDIGQEHCLDRCLYTKCVLKETKSIVTAICVHVPKQNIDSKLKFYRTETLSHILHIFEGRTTISFTKEVGEKPKNSLPQKKCLSRMIIIGGDFNSQFFITKGCNGQRKTLNIKENPLCSLTKFLITDPTRDTTINRRPIDHILMKVDINEAVQSFDNNIENLQMPERFDHFLVHSKVSVMLKRHQLRKKILSDELADLQKKVLALDYVGIQDVLSLDKQKEKKKYITFDVKSEKNQQQITKNDSNNSFNNNGNPVGKVRAVRISGKLRCVHIGAKGGIYYFTPSYNKCYLNCNGVKLKTIEYVSRNEVEPWSFGNVSKAS